MEYRVGHLTDLKKVVDPYPTCYVAPRQRRFYEIVGLLLINHAMYQGFCSLGWQLAHFGLRSSPLQWALLPSTT